MSRLPTRVVGGLFAALGVVFFATVGSVVLLVVFGVMGLGFLVGGERRKVRVTAAGVVSVPAFGRSRASAWSDIDGFVPRQYVARYSGWVVAMQVRGHWVNLPATQIANVNARSRAAVNRMADQLNADLERARQGR